MLVLRGLLSLRRLPRRPRRHLRPRSRARKFPLRLLRVLIVGIRQRRSQRRAVHRRSRVEVDQRLVQTIVWGRGEP